jgi:hypothetical protein
MLLLSILLVHCLHALDLHCAVLVLLQHHARALVFIMSYIIVHTRYRITLSHCILLLYVLALSSHTILLSVLLSYPKCCCALTVSTQDLLSCSWPAQGYNHSRGPRVEAVIALSYCSLVLILLVHPVLYSLYCSLDVHWGSCSHGALSTSRPTQGPLSSLCAIVQGQSQCTGWTMVVLERAPSHYT